MGDSRAGGKAMITLPQHIETLTPYIPGKPIEQLAREKKLDRIVKLASNENPLGTSPKAVAAAQRVLSGSYRYVDPGTPELVTALSRKLGRHPSQIICGSGIDGLLGNIITAFSDAGDEVLTSEGTFIGIYVNTRKMGRRLIQAPAAEYAYDLSAILRYITAQTRIIYLANPNNPTGTYFNRNEFERFMVEVPDSVLVVLDEAYYNYAAELPDYPNGLAYDFNNLIVTRTFSKDYGLAGMRVGYAIGPEALIRQLYKVRLPFEPNLVGQAAAVAALKDEAFLKETLETNRRNLNRMAKRFTELGIAYLPSAANFLLMILPDEEAATAFNAACLDRGLIVRHVLTFGVSNGIRINTGTDDEVDYALRVIEEIHHRTPADDATPNPTAKDEG
jgi:histidinol-phosphate aminotransferase